MERFSRALREVDRELEVREPERSRILLELAVDLEEMFREYRSRGVPEEEALRRAEAWLVPDAASAAALRRLHSPLAGRLLSSLSEVARSRVESAALVLLSAAAVAGGLWMAASAPGLWPPGPAAVAVLALAGAGAAVAGRHALDLFLGGAGDRGMSGRLPGLLALSGGAAVTGLLGGAVHLHRTLGSPPAGAGAASGPLFEGIGAAAGTATLGLAVGLALALAWFWLVARATLVRGTREELEGVVDLPDGVSERSKEVEEEARES